MDKWKSRPLYLIIIYGIASFCFGISLVYEYINSENETIKIEDLYVPTLNFIGFLLIFPITRKLIFGKLSKKFKKYETKKNNFIDGEFEDIEEDDDRKI